MRRFVSFDDADALMLEVAGTQGSQGCFAFACCFHTPFSLATADEHEDGDEGLAKQRERCNNPRGSATTTSSHEYE